MNAILKRSIEFPAAMPVGAASRLRESLAAMLRALLERLAPPSANLPSYFFRHPFP